MKISGLQKTSLLDFPGNIVCIIFTQGCNFECPYCHNPSLIKADNQNQEYMPLSYLMNFLKKRKKLIDGVSITGGEPTLQKDLFDVVKLIKKYNLKVKLDTNGTRPDILKTFLETKMLDYIAMDVKAPLSKYHKIVKTKNIEDKVAKSIDIILKSDIDYEFRTTVVPTLHDYNDIKQIGKIIQKAKNYYIQNFRPKNTLKPNLENITPFAPQELEKFKEVVKPFVKKVEIRN